MELKNVDLVTLNKAAMLIQEHASLGYNLIKVVWTKAEIESVEYVLKNLGYIVNKRKIKSTTIGPDYLMLKIVFIKPQQGPYIFVPIKVLTAVEAKQLAEQNEANCKVLDDISNRLEKENKETLVYKVNEINLNGGLLKFLAERKVKVYQDGDEVKVYLKDYFYWYTNKRSEVNARIIFNNGISC